MKFNMQMVRKTQSGKPGIEHESRSRGVYPLSIYLHPKISVEELCE